MVVARRERRPGARIIAERFGIAHATDGLARGVRHDLDAVVVSSPPNVHREQVTAALESGAHVLCEKPFAITSADAWAMVERRAADQADAARGVRLELHAPHAGSAPAD